MCSGVYVYTCVYIHTHIYIYARMCMCMCMCMCLYMYTYSGRHVEMHVDICPTRKGLVAYDTAAAGPEAFAWVGVIPACEQFRKAPCQIGLFCRVPSCYRAAGPDA